ncbi:MAG: carbohydrate ABC transporter permease, partial [Betaproteobacteria bacterium]
MTRAGTWQHGLRIAAILGLLGAAAFPLYWMFVTSMTPSSEL